MELTSQKLPHTANPLDGWEDQSTSTTTPSPQPSEDSGEGGDGSGGDWFGFEPVNWEYSGQTTDTLINESPAASINYGTDLKDFIPLPIAPHRMSLPDSVPLADDLAERMVLQATRFLETKSYISPGNEDLTDRSPSLESIPSPNAIFLRQTEELQEDKVQPSPVPGRWFQKRSTSPHPWISQREITFNHFRQCRAQGPAVAI